MKVTTFFKAVGLGAGLMYYLDPERGRRRRALARDRLDHLKHETEELLGKARRDARNRARGVAARLETALAEDGAGDQVIEARVRSLLGLYVRNPHSIEVTVEDGRVGLRGPVLAREARRAIRAVRSTRGVKAVDDGLDVHEEADIPALQTGNGRQPRGEPMEVMQSFWSPATRLLVGTAGGLMALSGIRRGGITGAATKWLGIGLAARAATNLEARRLTGLGAGPRAVDIHKTLNVDAPVERVFRFWEDYENLPRFMAHVRSVENGDDGRSHWTVDGPLGSTVEWDTRLTTREPNEELAWETLPGSPVEHAGRIRFRSNNGNGTQMDIHMTYNPVAGALGHGIATLLGADPKRAMDEDLLRFKSLMEHGRTTVRGRRVELDEDELDD